MNKQSLRTIEMEINKFLAFGSFSIVMLRLINEEAVVNGQDGKNFSFVT